MPAGQLTRTSRLIVRGSPALRRTSTVPIAALAGSFVPARIGLPISALPPASVPVARPRSTCSEPATLPEREATTSVVAAPPASSAQQPAVAASFSPVPPTAAPPPPNSDNMPASGPAPTGGISARRRPRVAFSPSRNSRQAVQPRTCRSACSDGRRRSSCAISRTSRIAAQSASRASAAATRPLRARLTSCREAAGRDLQRARHLLVAEPVELTHQQRGALLLGQVGEVLDQPPQLMAAAERRVDVLARAGAVGGLELDSRQAGCGATRRCRGCARRDAATV